MALFHRDASVPVVPVEGEETEPPAGVTRTLARTGTDGRVAFARPGAGTSLLSAVLIRRPPARTMLETGAMWESLWASSVFVLD